MGAGVSSACGNNEVSADKLKTAPQPPAPPAVPAVDHQRREAAVTQIKSAGTDLSKAEATIRAATDRFTIQSSLRIAEAALENARRAGGGTATRAALRDLERQVEGLRREAREAVGRLDAEFTQRQHMAAWMHVDRLSPSGLGVTGSRVGTPSPSSPKADPPLPSPRDHTRPGKKVAKPSGPGAKRPERSRSERSVGAAERAARNSATLSLETLTEEMKAAHKALAELRRQPGASERDVNRLADAAKTIQRAADKRRAADTEHAKALLDYTGVGYQDINDSLRRGTIDDVQRIARRSSGLSAALKRMPIHEGTVLHGSASTLDAETIARYEPGASVVEPYLSTTVDPEREFGGNVLWVVESRRGRDVSGSSAVPHEGEVLFDKFSRFAVLAKEFDEDLERWVIYMEESS